MGLKWACAGCIWVMLSLSLPHPALGPATKLPGALHLPAANRAGGVRADFLADPDPGFAGLLRVRL
ncbi:MAG TPA: hypothetical protein VK473_00650 [Terriglobales bacterium]|nr:hypothetical protein [Terriglobales bacterium]